MLEADGRSISQSSAIILYAANAAGLTPAHPADVALVCCVCTSLASDILVVLDPVFS